MKGSEGKGFLLSRERWLFIDLFSSFLCLQFQFPFFFSFSFSSSLHMPLMCSSSLLKIPVSHPLVDFLRNIFNLILTKKFFLKLVS